jgi:hypothetical protein
MEVKEEVAMERYVGLDLASGLVVNLSRLCEMRTKLVGKYIK